VFNPQAFNDTQLAVNNLIKCFRHFKDVKEVYFQALRFSPGRHLDFGEGVLVEGAAPPPTYAGTVMPKGFMPSFL